MMKRILALVMCMLMLCGTAFAEGFIAPAELNADEQAMIELVGMNWGLYIFDFAAPEGAKTALLTLWELENGVWAERDLVTLSLEDCGNTGRVALYSEESLGSDLYMCLWTPHGYTSIGSDMPMDEALSMMNQATEPLYEQAPLAPDMAQPLMMQFLSESYEMEGIGLHCWHAPESLGDFGRVYAVTLTCIGMTEQEYSDMRQAQDELYGW